MDIQKSNKPEADAKLDVEGRQILNHESLKKALRNKMVFNRYLKGQLTIADFVNMYKNPMKVELNVTKSRV